MKHVSVFLHILYYVVFLLSLKFCTKKIMYKNLNLEKSHVNCQSLKCVQISYRLYTIYKKKVIYKKKKKKTFIMNLF